MYTGIPRAITNTHTHAHTQETKETIKWSTKKIFYGTKKAEKN